MLELIECLCKEKRYKQEVKYRVRQFETKAYDVFNLTDTIFGGPDSAICQKHSEAVSQFFNDLSKNINGDTSEKWYNILIALVEEVCDLNSKLVSQFRCRQAEVLYNASSLLSVLGYSFNEGVKPIVQIAAKKYLMY